MNNQVKLIELEQKAERYRKALEEVRTTVKVTYEETAIERRKIAEKALGYMPDTPPVPTIKPGDKVRHYRRGEGIVLKVYEDKIIANYNGISVGCKPEALEVVE
ncbi:hypothetical protein [Paenibacillus sp. ISL-20]|uniref:hypothetical protein n=1 Tax=Paenibacillus sp. ISL-20 TaxID=2819163 RepID=UPI001BEC7C31|nr:hypothetical protein [Paenibacillus sp. ISL-20]MBT2759990.1 hypothetical protein [Paenibacillus sp. ISL-20]